LLIDSLSPFLKIGTTFAIFILSGTSPVVREILTIWEIGEINPSHVCFSSFGAIESYPLLDLGLKFRIMEDISSVSQGKSGA